MKNKKNDAPDILGLRKHEADSLQTIMFLGRPVKRKPCEKGIFHVLRLFWQGLDECAACAADFYDERSNIVAAREHPRWCLFRLTNPCAGA